MDPIIKMGVAHTSGQYLCELIPHLHFDDSIDFFEI